MAGADALLDDLEREQAEEAVRQAWRPLAVWLDNDASLTGKPAARVQDSLLRRRIRPTRRQSARPSRARAIAIAGSTVITSGTVPDGMAAQLLEPKLSGFREIARNVLLRDELAQGHDLVR